jgi:dTDP-4-amino-4,6-dideoxygalactose transaminase
VIAAVNAEGIPCFVGSCGEIYREKAFTAAGWQPARLHPVAPCLNETSLAFLMHPTLTEQDMQDTCAAVANVLRLAVQADCPA